MKRTDACQVAAELAKPENKNIVTSMNQETGEVQAFMMPRPYFVRNDAEIGRLRDRVAELKNALAKLEARGAPFVERTRLEQELKVAERELASAEFGRRQERERQRSVTGEV